MQQNASAIPAAKPGTWPLSSSASTVPSGRKRPENTDGSSSSCGGCSCSCSCCGARCANETPPCFGCAGVSTAAVHPVPHTIAEAPLGPEVNPTASLSVVRDWAQGDDQHHPGSVPPAGIVVIGREPGGMKARISRSWWTTAPISRKPEGSSSLLSLPTSCFFFDAGENDSVIGSVSVIVVGHSVRCAVGVFFRFGIFRTKQGCCGPRFWGEGLRVSPEDGCLASHMVIVVSVMSLSCFDTDI